jgi:hypothetical protein
VVFFNLLFFSWQTVLVCFFKISRLQKDGYIWFCFFCFNNERCFTSENDNNDNDNSDSNDSSDDVDDGEGDSYSEGVESSAKEEEESEEETSRFLATLMDEQDIHPEELFHHGTSFLVRKKEKAN